MRLWILTVAVLALALALDVDSAAQICAHYPKTPVQTVSGQIVPFPVVRVCSEPATGLSCTPLVNLYRDRACTQALSNPMTGDAQGNVDFYTPATRVHIQENGQGINQIDIADVYVADPLQPVWTLHAQQTCSSTVTWDTGTATMFPTLLTANCTASVANAVVGRVITVQIIQNSGGGHSVTWPGNFVNTCFVGMGPNQTSTSSFWFDGSNWNALGGCGGGALSVPASSGATVTANGGLAYDLTNGNFHFGSNGVDNIGVIVPSSVSLSNGDCAKWTVTSGNVTLNDNGGPCAATIGAVANNFLTSYSATTGTFSLAQPSFSNLSGSLASGQLPNPITSATITSATIASACIQALGSVRYANCYSGATADVQITAAIADLPTAGGIVDARGFGATTQTLAAPLVVGTLSKNVTLLVDKATIWNITVASGADAICIDAGSSILGSAAGGTRSGFTLASSANVASVISPCHKDGTQGVFYLSGVVLTGNMSATVTQAMIDLAAVSSNARVGDTVVECFPTIGIQMRNASPSGLGPVELDNVGINGSSGCSPTSNTVPVAITGSGSGIMSGIIINTGEITHQGTGQPLLKINGGSSALIQGLVVNGTYFENTSATGNGIVMQDVRGVVIQGISFGGVASTGDAIQINAGSTSIVGATITRAADTNPVYANLIHDNIRTFASGVPASGHINFYASGAAASYLPSLNMFETSGLSGVSGQEVCGGDPTAHALKCSYNNSAFSSVARYSDLAVARNTSICTTSGTNSSCTNSMTITDIDGNAKTMSNTTYSAACSYESGNDQLFAVEVSSKTTTTFVATLKSPQNGATAAAIACTVLGK